MTKEKWIEIKYKLPLPVDVWWEFYREKGGKVDNLSDFERYFALAMQRGVVTNTQGSLVRITDETAYRAICNFYDDLYGLT